LAINQNAAPLKPNQNKHASTTKNSHATVKKSGLMVTGKGAKKMSTNFRHGTELRDSIANINQERLQA